MSRRPGLQVTARGVALPVGAPMRRSPSQFRSALLTVVLAVALPAAAGADLWYEHYARAEKALADRDWAAAVAELNQALEKKGDSGARVRTYGMKVEAYFPYLRLGVAYYHLGQLDAALQAFDTEERLGAVAGSEEHQRELQQTRALVRAARQEALEEERRRIGEIVETSLAEAGRLEGAGRLRAAAAALGRALAVEPDNAAATASLERLRGKIARQEERAELEARRSDLVARGRGLLDAEDFEGAAGLLQQALELAPGAEARDLLATAREGLRRRLDAVAAAEREGLVGAGLEAARSLEAAGDLDQALTRLQSVLALQPENREATVLQDRLLEARAAADRDASRRQTVEALLADTRRELAAGRVVAARAAANRILALDPAHGEALEAVAAAYRELNRSLLGSAPPQNIPPAIRFADLRRDLAEGLQAERVTSPEFRLNGVVIDESPVEVAFVDAAGRGIEATVREQPVGGVYITEFSLDARLGPGLSTFRLTATDAERLSTSSDYAVLYVRPLYRVPWLQALGAAAVLLAAAVLWGRRLARRRSLRRRRFNPYVAGAPVLDDRLFFGRRELIDRILQTVHNNSLLLYGERRIGKTSIQHHLRRRLRELEDPDYEFFPVYVDLQGVPEERFFQSLADDVFEELAPQLEGLTPSSPGPEGYTHRQFVRDLHAVIGVLKRRTAKRVKLVLLIDEVDELNDYDPRINQRLRSLFMKSFAEQMVAVVSGVEIRKRWEREASPWYNFFEELEVTPFRPEDARALVERPVRGVFGIDEGVVERILDLTESRPYRIQRLCMAVVNRLHEQGRYRITLDDVDAVGGAAAEST